MDNAYLGGPVGEKITVALSQQGNVLDEDCLSINVWTKPQTGEKRKAVLFWIYGGGMLTSLVQFSEL
jgi:carboxylesterase type B